MGLLDGYFDPDEFQTSGGLLGRLRMQPPSPPLDGELRGFYRDDAIQPWTLQRRR